MIGCRQLQWGAPGQPLAPALDLYLPAGSQTALIGGNGSGKSSLLKVIAGWQRPLSGSVHVDAPRLGGIAVLQQQQSLDRQFPVSLEELVATAFRGQQCPRRERQTKLRQVLRTWQLEGLERHPLQALSGGQLQRALLARMSLSRARLLLLDEPEAALDQTGQTLLWQQLSIWQAEGRTLLLASHALEPLGQRLENALLISSQGCRLAPLGEFLVQQQPLYRVA
jgi:zinc/manganese transport system ATP-binding protein